MGQLDLTEGETWQIPVEGRWEYPQYVTFRPGNGREAAVNPPRFSWPYVRGVFGSGSGEVPLATFRLQVSAWRDMSDAVVDLESLPFNFYNELAPLPSGKWYWRCGWEGVGEQDEVQWSEVRSFRIADDTPRWDRSVVQDEIAKLEAMARPRLGPPDGDWLAYGQELKTNPVTAPWFAEVTKRAEDIIASDWWKGGFVENDQPDPSLIHREQRHYGNRLTRMCHGVTLVAYMWKLTGDPRYALSKDYLVRIASWPKGGLVSPEVHGGLTKMPTQVTDYLATGYDILYHDLTEPERAQLLQSVEWRLESMFFEKHLWADGEHLHRHAVARQTHSHPYQNFFWVLPAALLTAGDSEVADKVLPLMLNYSMGVTAGHGPDEGWTEGQGYAVEKPGTMYRAQMAIDLLMPGLDVGRNPQFTRFGEWYRMLVPLGLKRAPFGDQWFTLEKARSGHLNNMRMIAWLTKGRAEGAVQFYDALKQELGETMPRGFYARPWLDLRFAHDRGFPAPAGDVVVQRDGLFPDGGWAMANSKPLDDRQDFNDAVGMVFQARPTGGYSHSYPSDGSFVWYAYGQTLSGGGGALLYPETLSRRSWSHNTAAINGRGQVAINAYTPYAPSIARLVAHEARENLVWWAADLTDAYRNKENTGTVGSWFYPRESTVATGMPEVESVLRFVLFIDRKWFVMYDDIQLADGESSTFQWIYHIQDDIPLAVGRDGPMTVDYRLGDVQARLALAHASDSLNLMKQTGRAIWVNPVTGEDTFPETDRLTKKRFGQNKALERDLADYSLWFNTKAPANRGRFLVGLFAARSGDAIPELIPMEDGGSAELRLPSGEIRVISFGDDSEADIFIDVNAVRAHAATAHGHRTPSPSLKEDKAHNAMSNSNPSSLPQPVLTFTAGDAPVLQSRDTKQTLALPEGGRVESIHGKAWQITDKPFAITSPVEFASPQGSLVFEFMLTGIESTLKTEPQIIEGHITGRLFTLPFMNAHLWVGRQDDGTNNGLGINFNVKTVEDGEKWLQLRLSRLEGNKPYQLILNWDEREDKLSAYLQGVEQSDMAHWTKGKPALKVTPGQEITIGGYLSAMGEPTAPIAVTSAAFYDQLITPKQARALAESAHVPSMAGEGRTIYNEPLDLSAYNLELVYENDFNSPIDWVHENDLLDAEGARIKLPEADWVLEGKHATLEQTDGKMIIRTAEPEERREGHMTLLSTKVFPEDLMVEYTFSPKNDQKGLHIIFFNTHNPDGESIFDLELPARRAEFGTYIVGEINGYHISPWASDDGSLRRTANMRKNSGFRLVAVGNDIIGGSGTGPHQIRLFKHGGKVQLEANGVKVIEYLDDGVSHGPVWDVPGNIGLRFMAHTGEAAIDELKVYRVTEKP